MRDESNGANRPVTRPILNGKSPQPTAVSGETAKSSERVPRNGVSVPGMRRYGGPVVQPPVPARAPYRRKELSNVPLHPALQRKLLIAQEDADAESLPIPSRAMNPDTYVRTHTPDNLTHEHAGSTNSTGFTRLRDAYGPYVPQALPDETTSVLVLPDHATLPARSPSASSIDDAQSSSTVLMPVDPAAPNSTSVLALVPVNAISQNAPANVSIEDAPRLRIQRQQAARARHRTTRAIRHYDWQTGVVGLLSFMVGITAIVVSAGQNLILQYPDARSHLEIARRVFDNRAPGLVQLGTVWLPVPHLLLLPFVNIDVLWATGLAGSIVGILCLVVTTVTLFLAVRQLTGRTLPAWLAAAVVLTNPSFLYIQTTALTEPVLLASMTGATYFLLRWTKDHQTKTLLAAGVFSALAVGSRYDGWFFAVISTLAIALTVLAGQRRWQEMQGIVLAYATVPLYMMALWFLYNWIYFGDPLEFQRGAFSAQQQQKAFEILGQLGTKHNLLLSIRTYLWTIYNNTGAVMVGLAVIGLIAYILTTRFRANSYLPYIFLAPIPFNILALWLGQTIIRVPQVSPGEYFNIRYGLLILPGVALFIAYLYHRLTIKGGNIIALPLFAVALVFQGALWWTPDFPRQVPVVAEGVSGGAHDAYVIESARFLHDAYHGGNILIDDSTTHITTLARIPIHEYVGTYSGALWRAALIDPTPVAKWIVVSNNKQDGVIDILLKTASENPYYFTDYNRMYANNGLAIYERKPELDPKKS